MTTAPNVLFLAAVPASSIAPAAAQGGLPPGGDLTRGTTGWSNIRFDDPTGWSLSSSGSPFGVTMTSGLTFVEP